MSSAIETFSEPCSGKTAPPRAGVNFECPYRVPWPVQNSCSRMMVLESFCTSDRDLQGHRRIQIPSNYLKVR